MSKSYYFENLIDRVQGFRRRRQDHIKVDLEKIELFCGLESAELVGHEFCIKIL